MDLDLLLARSRATDAFAADVRRYAARGTADRLSASRSAPPVKVLRVVAQLLACEPDLEVERLHVDAWSGCSDFAGVALVRAAGAWRRFDFVWDCRWRAEQEGWLDPFGLPDQIRAAREYGWRCFAHWGEATRHAPAASA